MNPTNALIKLPDKVGKKIKPPLTQKQVIAGLVETKLRQYYTELKRLTDIEARLRKDALNAIGRCIAKLRVKDFQDGATDMPQCHDDRLGSFHINFNGEDDLNEEAKKLVKAYHSAVTARGNFQNSVTPNNRWANEAEIRRTIHKSILESIRSQNGQSTDKVMELLDKPGVKLAFENMLAAIEGKAPVETEAEAIAA